uniref:Uncharacterized protein n=1 Tax=Oryza barthii TaxID=65489 RepID=A0A0D3EZZ0_9ORYZ
MSERQVLGGRDRSPAKGGRGLHGGGGHRSGSPEKKKKKKPKQLEGAAAPPAHELGRRRRTRRRIKDSDFRMCMQCSVHPASRAKRMTRNDPVAWELYQASKQRIDRRATGRLAAARTNAEAGDGAPVPEASRSFSTEATRVGGERIQNQGERKYKITDCGPRRKKDPPGSVTGGSCRDFADVDALATGALVKDGGKRDGGKEYVKAKGKGWDLRRRFRPPAALPDSEANERGHALRVTDAWAQLSGGLAAGCQAYGKCGGEERKGDGDFLRSFLGI